MRSFCVESPLLRAPTSSARRFCLSSSSRSGSVNVDRSAHSDSRRSSFCLADAASADRGYLSISAFQWCAPGLDKPALALAIGLGRRCAASAALTRCTSSARHVGLVAEFFVHAAASRGIVLGLDQSTQSRACAAPLFGDHLSACSRRKRRDIGSLPLSPAAINQLVASAVRLLGFGAFRRLVHQNFERRQRLVELSGRMLLGRYFELLLLRIARDRDREQRATCDCPARRATGRTTTSLGTYVGVRFAVAGSRAKDRARPATRAIGGARSQ